jgi:TetR/AcrR family transcriptional regulator, mexJK operon transcriptional repressor
MKAQERQGRRSGMSNSLEIGRFKRGPGGRPSREEAERRHRDLLATTRRLLLEKGWKGTSIDEVSRQSGVAKRFIYARYADKAALFVGAIVRYRTEKIGSLHVADPPPEDVEEGLVDFGQRVLDIALTEESLAIFRLFIAEASYFRDQVKLLLEGGSNNPLEAAARLLKTYADRGLLDVGDARLAAEHFFILIVGVPQRLALLVGREPPEREALRLRAAVKLFLYGCRRRV